jgi:predicted RNA-binding Zn-ribbon protein involved in translation (DUF1610 family)
MPFADALILYTLILIVFCVVCLVGDLLWRSNHSWHLSKSRLMSCRKCNTVFLLKRQQLDRRCPNCGTRGTPFRMPYSGVHETLRQRAGNLEE